VITVYFKGSIDDHVKKLSIGSLVGCFSRLVFRGSGNPIVFDVLESIFKSCVCFLLRIFISYYTVKNDPLYEVLRYLQIVHLFFLTGTIPRRKAKSLPTSSTYLSRDKPRC